MFAKQARSAWHQATPFPLIQFCIFTLPQSWIKIHGLCISLLMQILSNKIVSNEIDVVIFVEKELC